MNPIQATPSGAFVTKVNTTGTAFDYSTYLGGSSTNVGRGIAVDSSGNAYVTGFTVSTDFPTTAGAFQTTFGGVSDAFVTKVNATGTALVYSTFLGGSNSEAGFGIAVDSAGNAYVTGPTGSTDFPISLGSFQTALSVAPDAFVTKLDGTGALVYSTYLGGLGIDQAIGIAVDATGNAYVGGRTNSTNFPTVNPIQAAFGGGFFDAFVTKVDAAVTALVYSTFLGGNDLDLGDDIAVDTAGGAYVTGFTSSTDFPTTVGAFQIALSGPSADAFVTKIGLEVLEVTIDIKPPSCPNPLNVKSNLVLPVAILGTADFDVTQVDPATVELVDVSPWRWALEDVAAPYVGVIDDASDCNEVGEDGFLDLTLKFRTQDVVSALGGVIDGDVLVLQVTGNLLDGTPILGEDVVVILKKGN